MSQTVKKHRALLQFLLYADSAQQKLVVKTLTSEQFDVISEIALNIYTGTYPLPKRYINLLKPYESDIRLLGSIIGRENTFDIGVMKLYLRPKSEFICIL